MSREADQITAALNRLATAAGSRWEKIAPLVDSELRKISGKLVRQFAVTGRLPTVGLRRNTFDSTGPSPRPASGQTTSADDESSIGRRIAGRECARPRTSVWFN